MTNSQGRWAARRKDGKFLWALVPEGKEGKWPGKISTTGFTIYNNVVEAEAPAQRVVDKKGSLK